MRKKITMLLASMLVCIGAMAQITVGSVYSIQNKNTKNAISQDANFELATVEANTSDNAQLWLVENGTTEGTYMLRNLASGRCAQYVNANYTHWYADYVATDFYVGELSAASGDTPAYYYISFSAISDATVPSYSAMHQSNGYVVRWEQTNNSSQWAFVGVEVADLATISETWKPMGGAKTAAVSELESLAKLSVLYPDATEEIAAVNAVTATGTSITELNTAAESIKTILANYKKEADGKSVVFDTKASDDTRAGLSITANISASKAYGTASEGDEIIWTIKSQTDGSFKLYSFVADKYLSTPGSNDNSANLTDEANAAAYSFIGTDENVAALVSGGMMLHQRNAWTPNFDLINWYDLNDPASFWTITGKEIQISREQYDLATAAKASLPYAIQQAYGLVTDAANYYSNWLSTAEGSYAALLDNASDTYFHSAYTDDAQAEEAETHYIQADLGEGKSVDEFYFYMAPRNANNRPKDITVSGSNDLNEEFTEIAQITTTLASTSSYMSAKLGTEGVDYRYIRLTVTSTNTGTKFFTLSELYFFPADGDAGTLAEAYNNFAAASITETAINDAATTLINGETTLALANIKKEVAALLEANESNHASTPALGQYTTEAYNALNAAYTAGDATQESLEAAIAAFKIAKNNPVFTIDGVVSYATGKSIYDNPNSVNGKGNTHYFKATNVYDKTMWWALDMTETTVGVVESVGIRNVGTGAAFWGTSTIKITETSENDGAGIADDGIFLFYTTDNTTPIHAQNDGQLICRWGDTGAGSGSAWKFTYVGNSYDLNKLTDDHVTALAALKTAYEAKAYIADAELGEGLGKYTGDKDAIVEALEAGNAIFEKSLAEQAALTVDEINSAATAINSVEDLVINLPEEGKFYRIKGADATSSLPGYYITGNTNADGGRIALQADADAATVFYYADGKLLSYGSGLYIGLNASHWTFATVDGSKPASTITFAGSPRQAGAYTIMSANRYLHYSVYGSTVELNRCGSDTDKEHDWTIEEVTTLPVAVSAAGYATLYAPVALTIPADVTVYTATVKDDYLTLTEVEGTIPANTGVLIEAEAKTYNFTEAKDEDVEAIADNAFTGALAKSAKNAAAKVYTLQAPAEKEVGFYLFNGTDGANTTYINGFRAWVELPLDTPVQGLRITRGDDAEDTTSIESTVNGQQTAVIYDLAGRRVEKMEKGIYIVNGRKVVVK